MPSDLEKIATLVSGNQTIQNKLIEKQTKAIADLADAIKNQKITVTAPDVKVNFADLKVSQLNIPPITVPSPEINTKDIKQAIADGFRTSHFPAPQVTVNPPMQRVEPVINVPAPIVNVPAFPKVMEVTGLAALFKAVIEAIKSIKTYSLWEDVDKLNPIPVRLVDEAGTPYKAMGGSSGGMSFAAGGGVVEPAGNPIGYQQLTVSTAVVTFVSIPAGASKAVITVESDAIRWRDDGKDPSASVGMFDMNTQSFELSSSQSLAQFRAIRDANAMQDAILNISFYKK